MCRRVHRQISIIEALGIIWRGELVHCTLVLLPIIVHIVRGHGCKSPAADEFKSPSKGGKPPTFGMFVYCCHIAGGDGVSGCSLGHWELEQDHL